LPLVSIIIPTTGRADFLDATLHRLLQRTRYPAFEVVLAIHRSCLDGGDMATSAQQASEDPRVRLHIHDVEPFDYARVNNEAAAEAAGTQLLFLNDDVEVVDGDWLETLVGQAQSDHVAGVGAFLEYPDGRVQHAGVVLCESGPSHVYRKRPNGLGGYFGRLLMAHDVTAVTGACLLVSRPAFDEVGGFDTRFAVSFNDIDLCLRLRDHGYRIVLTPLARLVHAESMSFGSHSHGRECEWNAERELLLQRWASQMGADVFHNPNLAYDMRHPERLAFPPRANYPWRRRALANRTPDASARKTQAA
jgi:GT2 family glycosyltransferase